MKNKCRFLIESAYLGSNYVGWQRQPNGISIQEEIEKAFSIIYQEDIQIHGSSRTDAGVHAKRQFAHADLPDSKFTADDIAFRLNNLLPPDISVNRLVQIPDDFHSRFEAIGRRYIYRINTKKDPFNAHHSYYFRFDLDIDVMNEAANLLLIHNNFQCFSKVKTEVNNFLCDVSQAKWEIESHIIFFTISANRFLRGMVRAIVGTLLDVGMHKISIEQFKIILASNDRSQAGRNVPAIGLTLDEVIYENID